MLPHSCQQVMYPVLQYNEGNPPAVPQMNLPVQMTQWSNYICAMVANTFGANLYNAPRVFAYNLVAENNWRNDNFVEVITLVFTILDLAQRQSRCSLDANMVNEAINQAVTMFVSKLTFMYDDLKSFCNPQELNAAMQNVQKMQSYIQAVNGAVNPGGNFGGNPMYQQQMQGQMSHMGGGMGMGMGHRQPMGSNLQGAVGSGNTGFSNTQPNQPIPSNPIQQGKFFQQRVPKQSFEKVSEPVIAEILTVSDWKTSDTQPYRSLFNPKFEQATYTRHGNGNVIETITSLQEPIVDREKHKLVSVLGNSFTIGSTERDIIIGNSVANLASIRHSDLSNAQEHGASESLRAEVSEFVYPSVIVDTFLESAMFCGRSHQHEYQKKHPNLTAYRCFAIIYRPQFTIDSYSPLLEKLSKAKTFPQMASALISAGQDIQKNPNLEDNKDLCTDMGIYLNNLDVMLTDTVNSFLINNLSLEDVTIDSFAEDVDKLPEYLEKQFSARYALAFAQFEHAVIGSLLTCPDEEINNYLLDILTDDGAEQSKFSFIPLTYSFTYLDALSAELGLSKVTNVATLIREDKSPVLYEMANSLFKQSEAFVIQPTNHLLITQDQKVFKIYKGYLSANSYLIGK